MKKSFTPVYQIVPFGDKFAIASQYCDGGAIFTDTNEGAGYSEEAALAKIRGFREAA